MFVNTLPFKWFWWIIHQRIGPQLHPITLPWCYCWFATFFQYSFPSQTTLNSTLGPHFFSKFITLSWQVWPSKEINLWNSLELRKVIWLCLFYFKNCITNNGQLSLGFLINKFKKVLNWGSRENKIKYITHPCLIRRFWPSSSSFSTVLWQPLLDGCCSSWSCSSITESSKRFLDLLDESWVSENWCTCEGLLNMLKQTN